MMQAADELVASPATSTEVGGPALVQPLRVRDYRLVFAGETISVLGDQFHFVALATLVFALTGSGLALGTVLVDGGAFGLQPISFAIAGVLVDAYATPMYLLAGGLILVAVAAALIGGAHATLDGKESMS